MMLEPRNMVAERGHQMFPTLSENEIRRMLPYGSESMFDSGSLLLAAGAASPGLHLILTGSVQIIQQDGLGRSAPVLSQGRGGFIGEVGSLSGRPSLVNVVADSTVEALLIAPEALRRLIIAEAELGERITRALILRRASLIESASTGPVLVGKPGAPSLLRLRAFLQSNAHPHQVLNDLSGLERLGLSEKFDADLHQTLVVCPDGSVLVEPSDQALATCLGMVDTAPRTRTFDVAIVGAGPAGLATAVYAASEGLSVVVLDAKSFGGQARASSRIENYLGFPTGISGQALTARAHVQAQKFGADLLIPARAMSLDCGKHNPGDDLHLTLEDGRSIHSRTVVIASGARYRRPHIANIDRFEGNGVWYWVSPIEARLSEGEEVALVGGGNSAGQAAVYLAGHAARVHVLVRSAGLAATMSSYLVDRLGALSNVEIHPYTEITELHPDDDARLSGITWVDRKSGDAQVKAIRNVFLFVGADPATEWIAQCSVHLDKKGFIETGPSLARDDPSSVASSLESSIPGVFAIGDVRAGSVKRVGAAIGEGAGVVSQLHRYLAANTRMIARDHGAER